MERLTLAEQLAARFNLDGTARTAEPPEDATVNLNPARIRPGCGVPENVQIGDWVKIRLPGSRSPNFQPVLIFGIYRDEGGQVVALDIFPSSDANRELFAGEFMVTSGEVAEKAGMRRVPSKIGTHNIYTVGNVQEREGGRILPPSNPMPRMEEDLFPDLIMRRAQSLLFRADSKWFLDTDLDPMWKREGLYFHEVTRRNIKSGRPSPDTASFDDGPVCHIPQAEGQHFQRGRVGFFCDYMIGLNLRVGQMHRYPEPGTWQDWKQARRARLPIYTHGGKTVQGPEFTR